MTTYNYKRESQLYVVYNGLRYLLDVYSDISYSQTFNETAVPVKTLHSQGSMFDNAVISKANPANFNFTIPLLKQADMKVIFDLLIDWDPNNVEKAMKTCDLYVVSNSETYKLEKAVFESGIFSIVKDRFISLAISGTATKLYKYTTVLPGTLQVRSANRAYIMPTANEVTLGGVVQPYISTISVEIKNSIEWIQWDTVHAAQNVINAATSQYAVGFAVSGRTLSGTITQYLTDSNNSNVQQWSTSTPLRIRTGSSSSSYLLDINIPSIVYTNRVDPGDIYMQAYDWRMTYNPVNLSDIVTLATA